MEGIVPFLVKKKNFYFSDPDKKRVKGNSYSYLNIQVQKNMLLVKAVSRIENFVNLEKTGINGIVLGIFLKDSTSDIEGKEQKDYSN